MATRRAPASANKRVFINCPFDSQYKSLFDAIIFAVLDLGFDARHALVSSTPPIRLVRIVEEIDQAAFSIHDLSLVGSRKKFELPRFNMPFELGLAYYRHHFPRGRPHELLMLDSEKYPPQKTLSDLSGLDPSTHNNRVQDIIACVRRFLAPHTGLPLTDVSGAKHIYKRLMSFKRRLPGSLRPAGARLTPAELNSFDHLTTLQLFMSQWMRSNPP